MNDRRCSGRFRFHRAAFSVLAALSTALVTSEVAHAQAGWRALDLGGGRRAARFLPSSVRPCDPLPLLLFLHGAGGTPEAYAPHLEEHAESLGLVLLLPQAVGAGWSGGDASTLNAALEAVESELNVDGTRTYLGGHSAGGAFAYLLAYETTGVAAVFSMSAPYYAVSAVADPAHRAPIRMYYGDTDPNYTGGSASALEAQWMRLGIPFETDVRAGHGHSSWPPESIRAGFEFLLARRYPGPPPASRCSDADAGGALRDADIGTRDAAMDVPADSGDRARDATGTDAADRAVDATARAEGGHRGSRVTSGCACEVPGVTSSPTRSAVAGLVLCLVSTAAGGARRRLRKQLSRRR